MSYENYADLKANKPVRWWHDAIIDDLLLFPLDTLEVRGKRLNYNPQYLSVIINTDLFKAAYQQRKQHFSANMDQALVTKTTAVAAAGLDLLLETMQSKRTQIPFQALADTVDKTLSRLGYGVKPAGPTVGIGIQAAPGSTVAVTVTSEQLAEARQALRAVEQANAALPGPKPERDPKLLDLEALPEAGES